MFVKIIKEDWQLYYCCAFCGNITEAINDSIEDTYSSYVCKRCGSWIYTHNKDEINAYVHNFAPTIIQFVGRKVEERKFGKIPHKYFQIQRPRGIYEIMVDEYFHRNLLLVLRSDEKTIESCKISNRSEEIIVL